MALVLLAGCGAGGKYGFAREYHPLSAEKSYYEDATDVSYEDVRRDPNDYRGTLLGWFGVVTSVEVNGTHAMAHMSYRTHQDRHLCGDETSGSCRVTVSDRQGGPFSATLELRSEDVSGRDRLWTGSLLKIYGSPTGSFDSDGGPILQTRWYRHWPRGTYVTTGAAGSMRR